MPGICGFISSHSTIKNADTLLASMQDSLVYRPRHTTSPLFTEENFAATDVHFTFMPKQTYWQDDECAVWIDGEFFGEPDAPHCEVIARHYRHGTLLPFLRKLDGIFAAAIYDRNKKTVHLITDRFGLKHLYILHDEFGFAWGSEIKALRVLPWFSPQVSSESFTEFIRLGHFTADRTWFNEVRLIPPGSIFSVNTETLAVHSDGYSDFCGAAGPPPQSFNSIEMQRKLGTAFRAAIDKRCRDTERIGVGLSGGLDSRAIFAAIPERKEPVEALTFGRTGCKDIAIAEQVTALRPSHHTVQTIDKTNWFTNRPEGIWITDGQINLLHLHGIEQIDAIPDHYDIELNGFLGDALLGGSYLGAEGGEILHFLNRGRRMIATALVIGNLTYHTRLPFFDNALFELTRAIPPHQRKNSHIYNDMLLAEFPEFFETIPWQKTGMPISRKGVFWDGMRFMKKGASRLSSLLHLPQGDQYFDYGTWVRSEPVWNLFSEILADDEAEIRSFVVRKITDQLLERHSRGQDCSDLICRYATAELWMRQYFRNEWPHS